jgi:hypothetical protein
MNIAWVGAETLPAKLMFALAADHRLAPSVFIDKNTTFWTRFSEKNLLKLYEA